MIYSSLALLKTILQKFIQKEKGFEKFRSPSEFQEQFDQALETHQRTTSNAVVAVVRRDAADTGQAAVPAIAAVKTVGAPKRITEPLPHIEPAAVRIINIANEVEFTGALQTSLSPCYSQCRSHVSKDHIIPLFRCYRKTRTTRRVVVLTDNS